MEDLCDVYDLAIERIELSAGQVFNIGGGADFTISVWQEFGPLLEKLLGEDIPVKRGDWRPGDQRVFISDIRKAQQVLGWKPKVGVEEGIQRLYEWVKSNQDLF